MIRKHNQSDCPDSLTDDEWCELYAQCTLDIEQEQEQRKAIIEMAIAEVLNRMNSN